MIGNRAVPRDPASDLADLRRADQGDPRAHRGPPRTTRQGAVRSRRQPACRAACARGGRTQTASRRSRTRVPSAISRLVTRRGSRRRRWRSRGSAPKARLVAISRTVLTDHEPGDVELQGAGHATSASRSRQVTTVSQAPSMGPKLSLEAPQRSPASERQSGHAAECGQDLDDPRSHLNSSCDLSYQPLRAYSVPRSFLLAASVPVRHENRPDSKVGRLHYSLHLHPKCPIQVGASARSERFL